MSLPVLIRNKEVTVYIMHLFWAKKESLCFLTLASLMSSLSLSMLAPAIYLLQEPAFFFLYLPYSCHTAILTDYILPFVFPATFVLQYLEYCVIKRRLL